MIQPMGARLLVQRIEQAKPESSTIIIPETIQEKPSIFALVWAVGKLQQGGIAVGDIVILKDFVGSPVSLALPGDETETDCLIVNEDDVLAVTETA